MVDPGAARVLLSQVEARSGLESARLERGARMDWFRAWSLVDLEKAGALVDAELDRIEKAGGDGLRHGPIFRMLETLVLPPGRREAEAFEADGPSWRPASPR